MMPSYWTHDLFLASIAVLLVSVEAVQVNQACYGSDAAVNCSQHDLWCQRGSIFITHALRGFKPASDWCSVQRPECWDIFSCCHYYSGDCPEYYTQEAFSNLTGKCWNKQSCRYIVPKANRIRCDGNYKNFSGYSEISYLCLPDSVIVNFSDRGVQTADSLVLRYTSSSDKGSYICLVGAGCRDCTVNVLLYRTSTLSSLGNCTSVAVSNGYWLPCNASWAQYRTYLRSPPFRVGLDVNKNNDASEAWALIYGNNFSDLRVTCEPWNDGGSLPQSASPGVLSSTTSVPANVSNPGVSADTSAHSSENSSNTAGIVGGVVGALLLLAVVVAVVVFFLKRRGLIAKPSGKVFAWLKGGNSRNSHLRAEPHVAYALPTSLPVYDNSAAAITDEARVCVDPDSDYNHLGQKPTSSASRDVTYGHLTEGSDATDYGYDHVTKGKPAVRSGDVVNNIYNTAGPPTAGPCYEDAYNVTVRANNRPNVINNIYNTPSPATEASPDVDYYNAAGVSQTVHDVINSD